MWSLTCVPTNVYKAFYKFKPLFRCVQARHFSVLCWLLMALILDHGKGKRNDLCGYFPPPTTQRLDADADGPIGPMG